MPMLVFGNWYMSVGNVCARLGKLLNATGCVDLCDIILFVNSYLTIAMFYRNQIPQLSYSLRPSPGHV